MTSFEFGSLQSMLLHLLYLDTPLTFNISSPAKYDGTGRHFAFPFEMAPFMGELLNFGGVYLFLAFVKEYNINQLRGGISIPFHDLKRPEFLWFMDARLFTTLRHFWKGQELECHRFLCRFFFWFLCIICF